MDRITMTCDNHHPEMIGYTLAPPHGWLEIAHSKMRSRVNVFKCHACGTIYRGGIPYQKQGAVKRFDKDGRTRQSAEHPREVSRTVINT